MTHEEAAPVVIEMMRAYLGVPEGDCTFTALDFRNAVNALPMLEYRDKRVAIAAFQLWKCV